MKSQAWLVSLLFIAGHTMGQGIIIIIIIITITVPLLIRRRYDSKASFSNYFHVKIILLSRPVFQYMCTSVCMYFNLIEKT